MKAFYLFLFLFLSAFCSKAQNAISFDSIAFGSSLLTEDAIYFCTGELIKSDYQGNVLWSKTGAPEHSIIKLKDNFLYLIYTAGASNFASKLDSAGNLLWSRTFNQHICTSQQSNSLTDIVINGNRVYILCNQTYQGVGGFSYPSLITLDTSGTIINVWCDSFFYDGNFTYGVERLAGGLWIGDHDGGNIIVTGSFSVDANGIPSTNLPGSSFLSGQFSYINNVLTKTNSEHCYFVNNFNTPYRTQPFIVFESDDGFIHQYKGYDAPQFFEGMKFITACHDSMDNLYILAEGVYPAEPILFKTDPYGNILTVKSWSPSALNAYQLQFPDGYSHSQMICRNDSLYVTCLINNKTSILVFDSVLNTSCFNPDLTVQINDSLDILPTSGISTSYVPPISYTQVDSVYNTQIAYHSNGFPVCIISSVGQIESNERLILYPNPVMNASTLTVSSEFENGELKIYNQLGNVIKQQKMEGTSTQIESAGLAEGLYIIKVSSAQNKVYGKFMVTKHN